MSENTIIDDDVSRCRGCGFTPVETAPREWYGLEAWASDDAPLRVSHFCTLCTETGIAEALCVAGEPMPDPARVLCHIGNAILATLKERTR